MEKPKNDKLDQTVIAARRASELRDQGYRARALKMYPHLCGRCAREFERENLHELTVHHRDHNHDNNPSDCSNWELLCLYCHDNEHQRQVEALRRIYRHAFLRSMNDELLVLRPHGDQRRVPALTRKGSDPSLRSVGFGKERAGLGLGASA